mmetsp:Transcript_3050/g.3633  ORF Transcript_3050/g.3633 Transcript_3050/m.3633 type:complete len:359 (-) Transcript_3050:175-1251(-)
MILNQEELFNEIIKDSHWTNCITLDVGIQRLTTITGLTSRSTYRVKAKHLSSFGDTSWSEYKIYLTAIESTKEIYIRPKLFARGTSAVNHDESIIMVDDNVLLQKADFKGLYMIVLNRLTLEKIEIVQGSAAISLKLIELDSDFIIIIVSSNQWENTFSISLGDQLQRYGGFYIKEFQYQYSRLFSEHTRHRNLKFEDISEVNNFFHPFCFIGIKGLKPGMAYESIRSNQGYFMQESPQPQAELTVFLEYNLLTHRYDFNTIQIEDQNRMNEDYETIHKNKNRSLMNIIQYLASTDLTVDLTALGTGFNGTYYDLNVLLSGETKERKDSDGNIVVAGVDLTAKAYYTFLENFIYNDGE